MARTLSAAVTQWKNREDQGIAHAFLFDVQIHDTLTIYLCRGDPLGTGNVSFGGHSYLASSIEIGDADESIDSELPSFRIGISNIDGIAGGYVETFDLEGRTVTVREVILFPTGPVEISAEEVEIQEQQYNRKQAVFVVGSANFFRIKRPWQTHQRHACLWRWESRFQEDSECGYPSDYFSQNTAQDFLVGALGVAEQNRKYGWSAINATKASAFNADIADFDSLHIASGSTAMAWSSGFLEAPYSFKKLTGDFDVWTRVRLLDTRLGGLAGIICQSNAGAGDSWVEFGRGVRQEGEEFCRLLIAAAGVDLPDADNVTTSAQYLRLTRTGNSFQFRYSSDGLTWSTLATKATTGIDSNVRLGLAISAPSSDTAPMAASFDFFRFNSGGDLLCARTAEDCFAKGNSVNFGAERGIPE